MTERHPTFRMRDNRKQTTDQNRHVAFAASISSSSDSSADVESARIRYMRKIDATLSERVFQVHDDSTPGLFPRLLLDSTVVNRNILNERKPTVFQHMAKYSLFWNNPFRFHHKFGIRHYLMIMVLVVYSLLGGGLFLYTEAEYERQTLDENFAQLSILTDEMVKSLFEVANVNYNESLHRNAIFIARMLKVEGRYMGSAYHKYELINERLTWNYGSAVFYAVTLFTTIGYGSIVCQTAAGKALTCVYATVGIPMMILSERASRSRDLELGDNSSSNSQSSDSSSEDDMVPFPMFLTVPIIVSYLLFCAEMIYLFDYEDGERPGLSFGDAFYFSFISVSTVGLGDVLPNNIDDSPWLAVMFLFGLALLSVVNTTVYINVERRLMESVAKMEDWLESIHYYRHGREGYMVFKSLSPNIQLLALALPLFDDLKERRIERMLKPERTELGKRLFGTPRSRSMVVRNIDEFRPTLGIINISNRTRSHRAQTVPGALPPLRTPIKRKAERIRRIQSERQNRKISQNQRTLSERCRTYSAM